MEIKTIPSANKEVLATAMHFIGIKEVAGVVHNPTILEFWKLLNIGWGVKDEFAWCAAAHNAILKLAGCHYFETGLARKGLDLPNPIALEDALPGDTIIFSRGNSTTYGHIGIFIRRTENYIYCMGGNQSDEYRISKYHKSNLLVI